MAVRLRFVGFSVISLGIGLDSAITAVFSRFQFGSIVLGLVMIGLARLWFYAASDWIFRQP